MKNKIVKFIYGYYHPSYLTVIREHSEHRYNNPSHSTKNRLGAATKSWVLTNHVTTGTNTHVATYERQGIEFIMPEED